MRPGDGHLPVVATALGRLSTAICFEGDHPDFLRQAGIGRADLLILPVNDWAAVKDVHLQMAAFRAIENGAPVLRPASFGASAAIDPLGRVLGQTDHFSGGPTLVAEIPVGHVPTLYPLVGDLFGWLCAAGTAFAALVRLLKVRREAFGPMPYAAVEEREQDPRGEDGLGRRLQQVG
jgi:apolipoprotein N-acyltransferase